MLSTLAMAVLCAQNESRPVIQKTPAGRTSVSSGKEMYHAYCAACHGADGKGDGPASAALKSRPSDLTSLAERNAGKFPELRVFGAISGDLRVTAHGSKDMPTWGVCFSTDGRRRRRWRQAPNSEPDEVHRIPSGEVTRDGDGLIAGWQAR